MSSWIFRRDNEVIQIHVGVIEVSENGIHEALESFVGIAHTEWLEEIFKIPKCGRYSGFWYVFPIDWEFMIGFRKVDGGEDIVSYIVSSFLLTPIVARVSRTENIIVGISVDIYYYLVR